jgi:hypothetical protein
MRYFYGKMALIGVAHAALFVVLYYGRINDLSPILSSDFLVFAMPAILALDGYLYFAWSYAPSRYGLTARTTIAMIVSVFATVISALCGTTVAFNIWGS